MRHGTKKRGEGGKREGRREGGSPEQHKTLAFVLWPVGGSIPSSPAIARRGAGARLRKRTKRKHARREKDIVVGSAAAAAAKEGPETKAEAVGGGGRPLFLLLLRAPLSLFPRTPLPPPFRWWSAVPPLARRGGGTEMGGGKRRGERGEVKRRRG